MKRLLVLLLLLAACGSFGVRAAGPYYVSTSGNDSNPGTIGSPFLTVAKGVSVLAAGETVYLRGGTYTGSNNVIDSQTHTVPNGTNFTTGAVTIAGYPGETVILRPADGRSAIRLNTGSPHYLIVQDLILDGVNQTGSDDGIFINGGHHNRFQRVEVENWRENGLHWGPVSPGDSNANEFLNGSIHNNGHDFGTHGAYITSSDNLFEGNDVYSNAGWGFHIYNNAGSHADPSRNILRGNRVHLNGAAGAGSNGGIVMAWGDADSAQNNLVYGNTGEGIKCYSSSTACTVYQNSVYGNTTYGLLAQFYGSAPTFRNNIAYANGTDDPTGATDLGGGTGTPVRDHNLITNPSFTNAAAGVFTLQVGSAAINAGADLTAAGVTTDFLGLTRPWPFGGSFDIGAYEYSTGYDFSMAMSGPTHVGRGHALYRLLDLALLVGPRDYVVYSVTGLPSGVTASFPDLEATCCGPLTQYEPAPTSLKLAASGSATTGSFTLTVTAVSGGASHNVTATIVVDPVPSALSYNTPSFTAIPSLATWVSHMTSYGATHCATLQDAMADPELKLGATYYDAERVYYQIATYTGNPATWNPCAAAAEAAYRDYYVIPNGGALAGYWVFTKGLRMDYERTGDTTSRTAAQSLATNSAFAGATAAAYSKVLPAASREVAYAALAYINAEQIGYGRNAKLDEDVDMMLGHMDQWFVSMNYRCPNVASYCTQATLYDFYIAPFMVSLTMDALIDYYQEISPDPRIPVAVKTAADWLWTHAWYAPYQLFWLDNWIANPASIPAGYWAPSIAPTTEADLNLLIAPAWAWLYTLTGDATYRDNGDAIFAGGVATAFLAGGKQFNQNYKWSFDYVSWRTGVTVHARPRMKVRVR